MNSFKPLFLQTLTLSQPTSWLLSECMEAKGRQHLFEYKKPEVLKTLREQAKIQSAESSNRIEGIEMDAKRLHPLLVGHSKPKDRPEEEILAYKRTLDWIHISYEKTEITPATIKQLHALTQKGAGDAGEYKTRNNEIIEFDTKGFRSVRFIPVGAPQVSTFMDQLCLAYRHEITEQRLPSLVLNALFILDFLCVHPFRDGNGRVSRLLDLLLLYTQGIFVGQYISLERIIEENKTEYYDALYKSSQHWHEGKQDPHPWINFYLSTLRLTYKEFFKSLSQAVPHSGKTSLVKKTILNQTGLFTLKDLQALCPNVSEQLIRKVLTQLKEQKSVKLSGKGRGATWKIV